MISTSVLFSFFEAIQATNADAYRLHVYGTAKMFEVTDPRQCAAGVLCQIFFHIRTQLAFVQLTSKGKETSIDIQKILHDRLSYEELPIFQKLTTHFTSLANLYSNHGSAQSRGNRDDGLTEEEYTAHQVAIDELWHEYTGNEQVCWHDTATNTRFYRDAFTALTVAYFNATRILLGLTAPRPTIGFHEPTNLYEEVLDAANFMQTRRIGCAYMRIAAPLLIVALHAPVLKQRETAVAYFESWERGSMRGVSELALETIRRNSSTVERLCS
jgi:cation transport regulator ChaB